ncbi:polysaccharide deacetylase [Caudoviricetes sp.]|nr:polysaccharide deacetylase [Caudoviricetes sp.]
MRVLSEHSFIEYQRSLTGWSNPGGTSAAAFGLIDEPGATSGQIVSLTSASGTAAFIDKVVNYDFNLGGAIELDLWSSSAPWGALVNNHRVGWFFSVDAGYGSYVNPSTFAAYPGWNRVLMPRGRKVGSDDPASIHSGASAQARMTAIRWRLREEAMTSTVLQLGVRRLAAGKRSRPIVAIRIDDWIDNAYAGLHQVLAQAKIPHTMFGITGKLGTAGYWTLNQVDNAVASGYCRIGNHTVDHNQGVLPGASLSECKAQILPASELIAQYWPTDGVTPWIFANPYGESGANYNQALTESGILQAFTVVGNPSSLEFAINPLYASTYIHDSFSTTGTSTGTTGSYQATSMSQLLARADNSISAGGLTTLGFHQVAAGTPTAGTQMSIAQRDELIGWCLRRRAIADFVFLGDAVRDSRERVRLGL